MELSGQEIAEALGGRRAGQQWMAPCPAHDDRTPSLAVRDAGDGKVLVHCHAGCNQDDVLTALRERGLWSESLVGSRRPAPRAQTPRYWYRTANGQAIYKERHDSPGDKRGKWCEWKKEDGSSGLDGAVPLPYRTERLSRLPARQPVLVVEGEKCVHAAESLGFTALCGPHGADSKPDASWVELVRGHPVWLLPDNDDPGREHMRAVATLLQASGVNTAWIELPDLPPKGDIADWVARGGDAQTLRALADQSSPKPRVEIISAPDLLALTLPPVQWAVEGLLPEGLTLFVGKTKSGKSWGALSLALGIAWGGKVFGKIDVEEGVALYLALEDSKRRLQSRLLRLTEDGKGSPSNLSFSIQWPRADEGGLDLLNEWLVRKPETRFIIVDTLKRFRPIPDQHKSVYDVDYESIQGLQSVAAERHVAILVVHHMRKLAAEDPLDAINGSSGLLAAADGIWILERERGANDATLYVVHREGEDQELALTWNPALVTWTLAGDAKEYQLSKERKEIVSLLGDVGRSLTPKEISESLTKNYSTTKNLLSKMLRAGDLRVDDRGRYKVVEGRRPVDPVDPEEKIIELFSHGGAANDPTDSPGLRSTRSMDEDDDSGVPF